LHHLTEDWAKRLAAGGMPDRGAAESKALTTYCHAIMNSASFLYVD
jgi:hypothetical protein